MHHAVVYEMPTAAAPEKAMANRSRLRVSGGLWDTCLSITANEQQCTADLQIAVQVLRAPILDDKREYDKDRDR